MKLNTVIFILSVVVSVCHGFSQPRIPDTKAEGCVDGVCGSVCSYDDEKLFPGNTLNAPGKCSLYQCTEDFTILITPCANDPEFKWTKPDKTKLYPECCGTKTFY
ncbi:unnamed protein product [Diamesa tonsa]